MKNSDRLAHPDCSIPFFAFLMQSHIKNLDISGNCGKQVEISTANFDCRESGSDYGKLHQKLRLN
jgi:hypothetical protein